MNKKKHSPYIQWGLLLFVSIIWGFSFIVRDKAFATYNKHQITFWQIFLTFIFFIPFIIKSYKKITQKNIKILIISAVVGNLLTSLFLALGQAKINSSLAGILSSLMPILTLVTSILFFKYQSNRWQNWVGIILGFLGVVLIIFAGKGGGISYLSGIIFIFFAALFASLNINIISFLIKKLNGVEIAAISFLIIGPPSGVVAFSITNINEAITSDHFMLSSSMLGILALITFIGASSYNVLIKISSHLFASFAAYLIPVVAILAGIFIGNDTLKLVHFVSILCIFAGIYWTQHKPKRKS